MDDAKRKKVMLGILAVLALGYGGYWFMSREPAVAASSSVPKQPRAVREATRPSENRERKAREAEVEEERPEREVKKREETKTTEREKKPAREPAKEGNKKKKNLPAV